MAEHDLSLIAPLTPSPSAWVECVLDDFDTFLCDHASAEKKASGMAMNVAAHYPDQPELLAAMVDLAVEELGHYREVMRLILARNLVPRADTKDPYVNRLNQQVRRGTANFLLDRLLVAAVVERRGAERFALLAAALEDPALRKFYQAIARSENRHWELFIELAETHCDKQAITPRFVELNEFEGELLLGLPIRSSLH
ncbi:MAG: tRNA-(ms[2]io[6]A)-hydroxylase [Pseudomonadota bacterium]